MFFLMQIIFIVLPSNMAAVQNRYSQHQSNIFFYSQGLILHERHNHVLQQ